ncbi:MAG TPA: hypothetical protein VI583_00290 [Cyclobacteriaceae bacterium]|nr:hypothetical protein [Cyclobacteriaceae bacterium]
MNAEQERLSDPGRAQMKHRIWGPYLADRQWGTVREDYSQTGNAWQYVNHDASRSKAYRWGEEGIGGVCDYNQLICIAPSLWNGKDPILKDNYFGLSGWDGNHGEDVKEYYYYLDNTPTHSYMKMLYKYPQSEFPYGRLYSENKKRGKKDPEYELIDTGIFDDDRYFDVFIEYAKRTEEDILIRIHALNRGPEAAHLDIIPQVWFRNTWSWGYEDYKPVLQFLKPGVISIEHNKLMTYQLFYEGDPELLFCDNETNTLRLYGVPSPSQYFKDGINDYITKGNKAAVNPELTGTKAGIRYKLHIPAGGESVIRLRLVVNPPSEPFSDFNMIFEKRISEANQFYAELQSGIEKQDERNIQRQALAGMLWSKQFYYLDVRRWLNGDPAQPKPPESRLSGRNSEWVHLNNSQIISMPDKWEYPWYASWDLAFHCIPLAMVDPKFAKDQLTLLTKEWYMHPNGQLPAYEWNFSDVNPPVHAWATWRVYKMDQKKNNGKPDTLFLETVFHKLLLNFTWWVNRKDKSNKNIFQGGFLGLDNIGVFDRSAELPTGGYIEQADGTAWMAMYSLNLMRIALELSKTNPVYQEMATKFLEHFLYIAGALSHMGEDDINLWDEEDKFFYDVLRTPQGSTRLKVRSMVGLIPLFAVEVIDHEAMKDCPEFIKRMEWFLNYRPDLANLVSRWNIRGMGERKLFSLLRGHRLKRILKRMLDETEFLSDYGIRALSKYHETHPYVFKSNGSAFMVDYQPAESESALFGGNSNWRGPIWMPVNFLIIESLQRFYHYYGHEFVVECPTNSGKFLSLNEIALEIEKRLTRIFLKDKDGNRPVYGDNPKFKNDPHFMDHIPFYEYFHGDNGRGIGASHQTGWTGLIAKMLHPRID